MDGEEYVRSGGKLAAKYRKRSALSKLTMSSDTIQMHIRRVDNLLAEEKEYRNNVREVYKRNDVFTHESIEVVRRGNNATRMPGGSSAFCTKNQMKDECALGKGEYLITCAMHFTLKENMETLKVWDYDVEKIKFYIGRAFDMKEFNANKLLRHCCLFLGCGNHAAKCRDICALLECITAPATIQRPIWSVKAFLDAADDYCNNARFSYLGFAGDKILPLHDWRPDVVEGLQFLLGDFTRDSTRGGGAFPLKSYNWYKRRVGDLSGRDGQWTCMECSNNNWTWGSQGAMRLYVMQNEYLVAQGVSDGRDLRLLTEIPYSRFCLATKKHWWGYVARKKRKANAGKVLARNSATSRSSASWLCGSSAAADRKGKKKANKSKNYNML